MSAFYKVNIGSPTGEQRLINIPTYDSTQYNIPSTQYYASIESATGAHPQVFDHTYTYIATVQQAYNNLIQLGFTDVILMTSSTPQLLLYFDETHRLNITWGNGALYETFINNAWTTNGTPRAWGSGGGRTWYTLYTYYENIPQLSLLRGDTILNPVRVGIQTGEVSDATSINALKSFFQNIEPFSPSSDPYDNAGDSDTGGGGGSWDDGSDPVSIPNLPSVGATNTGFISLFVPSQSQLKQVAEYMWGGLFDLSTYKRLFEDPMDCILGLSVVPVSVPTSGSANITVGNIELSGITLPVASQQYVAVDCGSLTVTPYFGSYLDYEPYTKMALFVPYSGVHTVNADDLMGRTVNLVYHIDILTGSLVAFLKCGDSVLYEFNGACSSNIPVNSINYASTIENAIRIAVNIGTTVATAGASAPLSAGAEGVSQGVAGAQNIARGVSLAGSTADGALSLKPNIDRAGSLGGTTGLLGNQTPYFIITRPRLCKPKDQNKIKGYPAFINYSVSDLVGKGYTEFDTILLQNLYLTDDEKNELESILKGGVYL